MSNLIKALPGIDLPVGEVTAHLASMWETGPNSSPSEFRASQMNVILHFGLNVSPEEARERFDALIKFGQRYPSRIIVLCPTEEVKDKEMTARLFSQCYIGESHREMCCCEALLLSYKSESFNFLANQVSIWLEGDLPTYHWFSGVRSHRIEKCFDNLLLGVRRCVFDSSIEDESIQSLKWPEPERVLDLANARLLPVKQVIGQFLSGYDISDLCKDLKTVSVRYSPKMSGEGRHLIEWLKECLSDCHCLESEINEIEYSLSENSGDDCPLVVLWAYNSDHYFRWRKFKDGPFGEIEAYLGKLEENIPTRIKQLDSNQVLAEAFIY